MSDQPPPPKPKPGSLRDRIAAFEKPNAVAAGPPSRPPVRPKPGNISWKPAPPSPTSTSQSTTSPETQNEEQKRGGMSATDAKESIGRGGSLKERMAALQGKGAFGGGPPAAPPPVGPKPVKRPPLVVSPPPVDEDEDEKSLAEPKQDERHEDSQKPRQEVDDVADEDATARKEEQEEPAEEEQDEEAKERERRAAIAARMARLGGARVGMGPPPVFGKKPEVKPKPKQVPEQRDEPKEEVKEPTVSSEDKVPEPELVRRDSTTDEAVTIRAEESSSSAEVKEASSPEIKTDEPTIPKEPAPEASQSLVSSVTSHPEPRASYDSSTSQSSVTTSRSPPTSMPLPAAPRRAGPPRSRSAKNIKAQAAKQDVSAEVPPVPSEVHTEPEAPTLAPEPVVQTEMPSTKDGGTPNELVPDPELTFATDESVVELEEKPAATTVEESELFVAPDSPIDFAKDEELQNTPMSPEEVPHRGSHDKKSGVPAIPLSDVLSKPEAVDEVPISSTALETDSATAAGYESDTEPGTEALESSESTNVMASATKDSVYNEAPSPAHEVRIVDTEQTLVDFAATQGGPPPTSGSESEIPMSTGDPSAAGALEEPQATTAQDETEDEEAARRMRIAERMAKMGGRNPFTAGPLGAPAATLQRKTSVDEPQGTASITTHEEPSTVEEDVHDDDIPQGREVITEPAVASDSHEVEDLRPRVSGMAKEEEDIDVPISEALLQEHEEAGPEHKTPTELPPEVAKGNTAPVSPLEESPLAEDSDEMAPPRITRPVPAAPPKLPLGGQEASPTPPEPKHASIRRSLPPPPQESTPEVANDSHDKHKAGFEDEILVSDHVNASPSAPSPPSSPLKKGRRDEEAISGETSDSRPPTPVAPEPSRRSIPPLPRTSSPPSSRRATSPPVRAPPVPSPPPISPQIDPVLSPTLPVRRSIPPPPRRTPSNPVEDVATSVPTRKSSQLSDETALRSAKRSSSPSMPVLSPIARTMTAPLAEAGPDDGVVNRDSIEEQEILEDSEPDPIDPSFYSPPRSPVVTARNQASFASRSREASSGDTETEDSEQARRRTIAERMAKLGGIKFGAPPPIPRKPPVAPSASENEKVGEGDEAAEVVSEEPQEMGSEEAERVRRQAISARLAGMGGMRFGMLPQISTSAHPRVRSDDSGRTAEAPQPQHPHTPLQPESSTSDGDLESEEGIKVEAGSEMSMEEVTADDATEEPEEVAPPVPSRSKRQSSGEAAPPLPPGRRPPVPVSTLPNRPPVPSTESEHHTHSGPARKVTGGPAPHPNDFVVVDTEEEDVPPPPPPRAARPPRSAPPPAPPPQRASSSTSPTRDMTNSQWELPDIPTGSFDLNVGGGLGLDASFTSEDSTTYPPPSSSPAATRTTHRTDPAPTPTPAAPPKEVQLSADELLQLWGVVGTAVHSAASSLFDKSKKTLIGDGTSHGFIMATLAQVPQASSASYGHLVYSQNAHAVLRRSSNIMPGDIIQLTEAKLKGHKGLQSYNQTVGTIQEPVVAIVSEFEAKRSKVKVFQANRHVGAQTVESTSYRLEDLKSGNIKVFRVASI